MLHARPDYDRIQDPANIITKDEPVFLLRAQDVTAAAVVDKWADLNAAMRGDETLIQFARDHAKRMREWHKRKAADITPEQEATSDDGYEDRVAAAAYAAETESLGEKFASLRQELSQAQKERTDYELERNAAREALAARRVWCVGARQETPFCDVYASRDDAVAVVRKSLLEQPWSGALPPQHRKAFRTLLDHGDFDDALRFYNDHVGDDDKWFIVERLIRATAVSV